MKVTVKVEGLRDLDAALSELPKITTAKAVVRRVLKKAAEPLRALAEQTAPRLTGALKISIVIGTKLTRRQARMARKEPKSLTEMFIGTSNPAAVPQEFGTHDQKAQPFMRPAWQATKPAPASVASATQFQPATLPESERANPLKGGNVTQR